VAQQENPNGFPSYAWNQLAFDGFFRHPTHGPTGATFRRAAAYHGNQALFLAIVEHFGGPRPLSFVQRPTAEVMHTGTDTELAIDPASSRLYAANFTTGGIDV
jgi:hypothetical protein